MANNTYLPPSPVVPGFLLITNITRAYPAVITIINSIYNSYAPNQKIKLTIPKPYGMTQANNQTVEILSIAGTAFIVDMDSRDFDTFVTPGGGPPYPLEPASLSPSGSENSYNILTAPFRSQNGQQGN